MAGIGQAPTSVGGMSISTGTPYGGGGYAWNTTAASGFPNIQWQGTTSGASYTSASNVLGVASGGGAGQRG